MSHPAPRTYRAITRIALALDMHYHTPFKRFAVALMLACAFAALAPAQAVTAQIVNHRGGAPG